MLDRFTTRDIDAHLAGDDVEQARWLSGGGSSRGSVQRMVERADASWDNGEPVFTFAVSRRRGTVPVGMVGVNLDWRTMDGLAEGDANVSYGLYPRFRGRGYATRAVEVIEQFLIRRGVRRAVIKVEPENTGFLRIPHRSGYRMTGILTGSDGVLYEIRVKTLTR